MGIILTILAWIGIILGSILLLLILMPIGYRVAGAVDPYSLEGEVVGRWAFGFLSVRVSSEAGMGIYLMGLRISRFTFAELMAKKDDEEPREKPQKKRKKDRKGKKGPSFRRLWGNRRLFESLAKRAMGLFHLHGYLRGTVGLGDPARTAYLATLQQTFLDGVGNVAIDIEYDYVDQALDIQMDVRGWLWPAQAIGFGLGVFLSPKVRRALRPA